MTQRCDAVIVGGGHNSLVAATLLGRAGWSVQLLERAGRFGGAAVSSSPFPGVDVRLSRYSYLVSLFPADLARELGLGVELRPRAISSYTPIGDSGLLVRAGEAPSPEWGAFYGRLARLGRRVFPTLTEPLRPAAELRRIGDDEELWRALFETPLSGLVESSFSTDPARGVVLTDALIGTFAAADDPQLRQNRCFLYHVTGNGSGRWDVPVGGMGAVTAALESAARRAGVQLRARTEVTRVHTDGAAAEVECAGGERFAARHVLVGAAPTVLERLLGRRPAGHAPEGSQLKVNMLLRRLPRLRDPGVSPELAFAGTFHVHEGYEQLDRAYVQAAAGSIPELPPCEVYCHSLTDPSILAAELRHAGAHTLTLFGLHMPARLFEAAPEAAKEQAVRATLRALDSVLAEPIDDCLWRDPAGHPCLEALTPIELETELAMPGGHIFHRDLAWPYAETEGEVGRWGVETDFGNVWLCGAGARRGGGVSGIPGHNAARAALAAG